VLLARSTAAPGLALNRTRLNRSRDLRRPSRSHGLGCPIRFGFLRRSGVAHAQRSAALFSLLDRMSRFVREQPLSF